jgi:hypothetical protein
VCNGLIDQYSLLILELVLFFQHKVLSCCDGGGVLNSSVD